MNFPDHYGRSLDGFNDRFGVFAPSCVAPEVTGLVLAFTDIGRFAAAHPETAQITLGIIADNARRAALSGRRVMCLVHSASRQIGFASVGAVPVLWNGAESLGVGRRTD
ncbi:barstar family protein [Streptomyces sp. NPDC050504]|uniref:barstar family protein n=1 Tax=Streptomyces sp. NPDC050504 TaxID=3365618 RepID=UPI0037B87E82